MPPTRIQSGSALRGTRRHGFHYAATPCIAACRSLISGRETIPPQSLIPPRSARNLHFPEVVDPEYLPLRPQRHVSKSVATMRRWLVDAIVRTLAAMPVLPSSLRKA